MILLALFNAKDYFYGLVITWCIYFLHYRHYHLFSHSEAFSHYKGTLQSSEADLSGSIL